MQPLTEQERDRLITQGVTKLRNALSNGSITLDRIQWAQEQDVECVRAREYWGDHNQDQRIITEGIKLRITARNLLLESELVNSLTECPTTTTEDHHQ
jgi:hypothetical protein